MNIGKNALIQSEQTIGIMGYTIEDMDLETEISENKIVLPDSKVLEEMNKLGLKKNHPREKLTLLWID